VSEKHKGYFHAALAVVGLVEVATSKSKTRTFLIGCCTGWHVYAVYEHFRDSKKSGIKK
jgi:hypothetical protein